MIPSPSCSCEHLHFLFFYFLGQNIAGPCQQTFCFTPRANFPAHNLNFHWKWRWWDWIQATFWNLFYFLLYYAIDLSGPFIKFLIYLTELRLRMYETLIYPVLPTDSIKTFLKRRYNFSLCKTESVNFPILILRNNFCKNFFFCFGIFFVLYTYLAGEFQKSSTALEQQGTLLHWRRLFTRYHSRFFCMSWVWNHVCI